MIFPLKTTKLWKIFITNAKIILESNKEVDSK